MSVKEFNVKKYSENTPNLAMGKFSSVQDVLNGFMLDGILGNYKEGELPLMQQNLSNVENYASSGKMHILLLIGTIMHMELYARINRNGLLFCSLD